MRTLTPKQQRFLEAYLGPAGANATEAARMAGYAGNRVTLAQIGAKTRRRPLIVAAVEADMERFREELRRKYGLDLPWFGHNCCHFSPHCGAKRGIGAETWSESGQTRTLRK
jgi:hypothetical protein